jgi:LPS O-antigen subunit length determinant protein (WzzB/FepE family)
MTIALWIILVHVIECLLIGGYLLIRKNSQLEKVLVSQQQYIDAISVVIDNSSNTIQELDNRGAFESDDEVGTFFRNLKEIQSILNQFNNNNNNNKN